jgi:hypothetical protein
LDDRTHNLPVAGPMVSGAVMGVISSTHEDVHHVADADALCAFRCVVDALSEDVNDADPITIPSSVRVLEFMFI